MPSMKQKRKERLFREITIELLKESSIIVVVPKHTKGDPIML